MPDWAAVIAGLAIDIFLTWYVAWEVALIVAFLLGIETPHESARALSVDYVLTYGGELFAFWVALRLSRSRSFRVASILAAAAWVVTFVDRWLLSGHSSPLWYEIALLGTAPLALLSLHAMLRRRRVAALQ